MESLGAGLRQIAPGVLVIASPPRLCSGSLRPQPPHFASNSNRTVIVIILVVVVVVEVVVLVVAVVVVIVVAVAVVARPRSSPCRQLRFYLGLTLYRVRGFGCSSIQGSGIL